MHKKDKNTEAYMKGLSGVPDNHNNPTESFYHNLGRKSRAPNVEFHGLGLGILVVIAAAFFLLMQPIEWSLEQKYKGYAKASILNKGQTVDKDGEYFTHFVNQETNLFYSKTSSSRFGYWSKGKCVRKIATLGDRVEVETKGLNGSGKRKTYKKYVQAGHLTELGKSHCRA
ncbi:hypothetical protein [Ahrensia marina]|uniref:Uncharacterized protein n=1 Tax=Ahrensia marina TaxID=1514904 RepID=A0A0M9GKK8_9HYPH|nr:hypothetical protein [Ahrensia marina]KPA99976.1 hypothetical protein SU32_16375 [Ahrensia marina]